MNQAVNYKVPPSLQHVAIIMDGNNRFAKMKGWSKGQGHIAGKDRLDEIVEHAFETGVRILTVFAFSSENWSRPPSEVAQLMQLFEQAIDDQLPRMLKHQISMRFVGDRSLLSTDVQKKMQHAEEATFRFDQRYLNVAISYGGQWDILQAAKLMYLDAQKNSISIDQLSPEKFEKYTALGHFPPVDLLIRTGGEFRVSNFILWQLAYAELYFSPLLWPEFTSDAFDDAVHFFKQRERRYGQTQEQVATRFLNSIPEQVSK